MEFKLLNTLEGIAPERLGTYVSFYKNTSVISSTTPSSVSILEDNRVVKLISGDSSFGALTDIYNNTIIFSETFFNSFSGKVYFYEKINSEWQLLQTIENLPGVSFLGVSLSIYKDFCLIGSQQKMLIYEKKSKYWTLKQTILPPPNSSISFGFICSINDNILCFADPGFNSNEGIVYLYELQGSEWVFSSSFKDLRTSRYPDAVSLYRDYYVGSGERTLNVFKKVGKDWTNVFNFIAPEVLDFSSVSIYKNIIALGLTSAGVDTIIYLFKINKEGNWENFQKIQSGVSGDLFGFSLDLYENRLLVGAPTFDSNVGKVYTYQL